MTGASNLLRTLIVYSVVLPLALIIGYAMASPMDYTTWLLLALVFALLSLPLLLRFHRPMLFLFWNTTAVVFFMPGRPQVWFLMAFVSLGIVVLQKALIRDFAFPNIRMLLAPLIFLAAIVLMTAKLRGGFGLASFGDAVGGGRRYLIIFAGMAGFLAMAASRIPPHKALLYVGLFFLGSLMNAIGMLINSVSPAFYWIFWIFPVESLPGQAEGAVWRSYGVTVASLGVFLFLLARYGLEGSLFSRRIWRFFLLAAIVMLTMLGGFRSFFVLIVLTGFFLAYFEGLFTSKYLIALVLAGVLGMALLISFATRLPLSIQRTVSVLPITVSQEAEENARGSTEWRLRMWELLLPEVPRYFWLGKGLAFNVQDLVFTRDISRADASRGHETAQMAGDFHNGPLTVLINFGIWGAIGWVWFLIAAVRAMHKNYRWGEQSLRTVNALLLAYLLAKIVLYFVIFGNFYTDLPSFLGVVGLSIALNGGIAKASSKADSGAASVRTSRPEAATLSQISKASG